MSEKKALKIFGLWTKCTKSLRFPTRTTFGYLLPSCLGHIWVILSKIKITKLYLKFNIFNPSCKVVYYPELFFKFKFYSGKGNTNFVLSVASMQSSLNILNTCIQKQLNTKLTELVLLNFHFNIIVRFK